MGHESCVVKPHVARPRYWRHHDRANARYTLVAGVDGERSKKGGATAVARSVKCFHRPEETELLRWGRRLQRGLLLRWDRRLQRGLLLRWDRRLQRGLLLRWGQLLRQDPSLRQDQWLR